MQEVKIKNNELGIPVYFEDRPVFSEIPSSAITLLMQDLERDICACVEKRTTRRKYCNKNKADNGSESARPP